MVGHYQPTHIWRPFFYTWSTPGLGGGNQVMNEKVLPASSTDRLGRSRASRRVDALVWDCGQTAKQMLFVMNSRKETETRIRADRHDDVSIILLMCKDLSIDKVVINFFLPYIPTVHGFFLPDPLVIRVSRGVAYPDKISRGHIDHPHKNFTHASIRRQLFEFFR